jgi:hypothetical protein
MFIGIFDVYRDRSGCKYFHISGPKNENTFRVREVLPGSVSITREQLAKAWDNDVRGVRDLKSSLHSRTFEILCKALGLDEA